MGMQATRDKWGFLLECVGFFTQLHSYVFGCIQYHSQHLYSIRIHLFAFNSLQVAFMQIMHSIRIHMHTWPYCIQRMLHSHVYAFLCIHMHATVTKDFVQHTLAFSHMLHSTAFSHI